MTKRNSHRWLSLSSCGLEFALAAGLFTWLGRQGDLRWGLAPLLTLVGFALGLTIGFVSLLRTLQRIERLDAADKADAESRRVEVR